MFDIANALKMGAFCKATYDLYDSGVCTLPPGYSITNTFAREGKIAAFLAIGENRLILANRGTRQDTEWVLDGEFAKTVWQGMEVHSGFLIAYLTIRPAILDALDKAPHLPVTVTGHSLGASETTLEYLDPAIAAHDAVAFAPPMVIGSGDVEALLASQGADFWRVTNIYDLVPIWPPVGFMHIGQNQPCNFNLKNWELNHALDNYLATLKGA